MESITTSLNTLTDMDIVEFVGNVFGIKLLEYQKQFIRFIAKYPDATVVNPAFKVDPQWDVFRFILLNKLREQNECSNNSTKTVLNVP